MKAFFIKSNFRYFYLRSWDISYYRVKTGKNSRYTISSMENFRRSSRKKGSSIKNIST